jgi:hypothetical protein
MKQVKNGAAAASRVTLLQRNFNHFFGSIMLS